LVMVGDTAHVTNPGDTVEEVEGKVVRVELMYVHVPQAGDHETATEVDGDRFRRGDCRGTARGVNDATVGDDNRRRLPVARGRIDDHRIAQDHRPGRWRNLP